MNRLSRGRKERPERYYLNRGLILEQVIARSLKEYLAVSGALDCYRNHTLNITNSHLFAKPALNSTGGGAWSETSLFPAVAVAAESDDKTAALVSLSDVFGITLTLEDVSPAAGDGRIRGVSTIIRRTDRVAIEIRAENIRLKNELYELVRLFVCGWMKNALEKRYEENGLAIFDRTVHGERSNSFNVDFGIGLAGALPVFEADRMIERTVIDTDVTGENRDGIRQPPAVL